MSAENVIINFTGDGSGLQPAESALYSILKAEGLINEKTEQLFGKMQQMNKAMADDSVKKRANDIANLAKITKDLDKSLVGGQYKKQLEDIKTGLQITTKELQKFYEETIKINRQKLLEGGTQAELEEFSGLLKAAQEELAKLGDVEDVVTGKTSSMKSELKKMKEELGRMKEGTPEFEALTKKAGELDDKIKDINAAISRTGSDTSKIEGVISMVGGLASGFQLAQGAAALLGSEDADLQKGLIKLNAVMAVAQGLQGIQNMLQKESSAMLLLNNLLYTKKTIAVTANTAAEATNTVAVEANVVATGSQVVATEAATAATVQLNTVLALNPYTAIATSVLAIAAAFYMWKRGATEAEVEQRKINQAIKEGTDYLEGDLQALEHSNKIQVANMQKRGATAVELAIKEGELGNARLKKLDETRQMMQKTYNESTALDEETLKQKKELEENLIKIEKQYYDEKKALEVKAAELKKILQDQELKDFIALQESKTLSTVAGSDAERSAKINEIRSTQAARIQLAREGNATDAEIMKLQAEDKRQITQLELQNYQHYLKGKTAATESYISQNKIQLIKEQVDTIESINKISQLEIEALKKRKKEAESDPTLNKSERLKLTTDLNLAILEKENELQIKILNIQKSAINAKLLLTQKGSEQEYLTNIELLAKSQEIELRATELTQEQVDEIKAKYRKQELEFKKTYQENLLQNAISTFNAELDEFGLSETKKLNLVILRLEVQRKLEISQAEGNASKILEINAKFNKQLIEEKAATFKAISDEDLKQYDRNNYVTKQKQTAIAADSRYSIDERKAANDEVYNIEKVRIENEIDINRRAYFNNLIDRKIYLATKQDLENKASDLLRKKEDEDLDYFKKGIENKITLLKKSFSFLSGSLSNVFGEDAITTAISQFGELGIAISNVSKQWDNLTSEERKQSLKDLVTSGLEAIQTTLNNGFAERAAARQQALSEDIAALEEQKNKEINVKNITEQQKNDIDKRFKAKENELKRSAWIADRDAKKSQAIINAALAITMGYAQLGPIAGSIFAGITALATGIEIANISKQQVPKFKKGKRKGEYEGFGIVDDGGKIEPILRADGRIEMATGMAKDRLTFLEKNDIVFPSMEHMYKHFSFPQIPEFVHPTTSNNQTIDYDKLAEAVANKLAGIIPSPSQIHNTFDGDSIKTFLLEGNNRTEIKNKYFSMT